ncbi:tRNA pseudouridine synthase B [Porphyridium purpureum]|uniref:tRNA pseudouridine(55) synthase n=1 Tax=Porphyridium purpureum TaxID=35688 RepID=A0A5J4YLB7_PORPP|nr:tRNA pseudouridine synthase B [Porphyridium purpureum]|eukprot:POR5019..scf244_11
MARTCGSFFQPLANAGKLPSVMWPCAVPRILSRGLKSWKVDPEFQKRRPHLEKQHEKLDKLRKKALAEAKEKGVEEVPECHFLLLNKPMGITNQDCIANGVRALRTWLAPALEVRYYKHLLKTLPKFRKPSTRKKILQDARTLKHLKSARIESAGNVMTLDKFQTGITVLAVEGATQVISTVHEFIRGTKEYELTALFGSATSNQYSTGEVIMEKTFSHVTVEAIEKMINGRFNGRVMWFPPTDSAWRHNGKPMYKWKREGKDISPGAQRDVVHEFKVIEFEPPRVRFRVVVDKGHFVRTFVPDLADMLKSAAHLTEMKRTRRGWFKIEDAIPGDRDSLEAMGPYVLNKLKHAKRIFLENSENPEVTFHINKR